MNTYHLFHRGLCFAVVDARPGSSVFEVRQAARRAAAAGQLQHDPSFAGDELAAAIDDCAVRMELPGFPTLL